MKKIIIKTVYEIDSIQTLKSLNKKEIKLISQNIREELIELAKINKIHLGSNLGVVELSMALLMEVDHNSTKLFYDTGHQCYVHKMLTNRATKMKDIRKEGGISGFPSENESIYDFLSSGHSSTSLSIAQGYNETNDQIKCIPIIGDAAINNGLALEALNDIAYRKNKMIIIVNDNGESISKTVGFLYQSMAKIKNTNIFFFIERLFRLLLKKWKWSRAIFYGLFKCYNFFEKIFFGRNIFQALGFMYVGQINGHNVKSIQNAYRKAKFYSNYGPVILHIKTKKSFGYNNDNSNSHSVLIGKAEKPSFTGLVTSLLIDILKENKKIRIINPAMTIPEKYEDIEIKYPNKYQDIGINEEHCVTKASGMALNGIKVIIPIYSTFLQRTYDQIHHDVSRLKLPILFLIDRADISPHDGDTHHGIYDVGMLKSIPNTIICEPSNSYELEILLKLGIKNQLNPFFIRFPNEEPLKTLKKYPIKFGEWIKLKDANSQIAIVSYGHQINKIIDVFGNQADIINAIFLNNLNEAKIFEMLKDYKKIIFYERIFNSGTVYQDVISIFSKMNHSSNHIHSLSFKKINIGHGDLEKINQRELMSMDDIKQIIKNKLPM